MVCYINGLENFKMEELKIFAKLRNVGGYKNMSQLHLNPLKDLKKICLDQHQNLKNLH